MSPASETTDHDVIVVGAGILGLASAYHIQRNSPGRRVVVLDRFGDVGQGNTGRSNAMFRNTFTSVDNQILSNASIDFYLHVQKELKIDIGVDPIGYLWMLSEKQLSTAEPHLRRMAENGVELRRFDARTLEERIPGLVTRFGDSDEASLLKLDDVAGGVLGVKCGRLAPDRLVGFYRDQLEAAGGKVLVGSEARRLVVEPVDEIGIEGEPFVWQETRVGGVALADGRVMRAGTVVVAAGAWTNELLDPVGIDGHAKAKKRQLFTVSVTGERPLQDLLGAGGFNSSGTLPFVILPKCGLFIKAVKESNEFWLGCEDEVNRPYISFPAHDLDEYQAEPEYYRMGIYEVLKEYLPQFKDAKPERMWAGLYSYNTLDNLPYVFSGDGLIVVGGDSGSGVMKGDSLGRIVDAVYRDGADATATLYGGASYSASKLGFRSRDVEREDWVL